MRFMVMVKATKDSEAGVMPTQEEFAEMGAFNEALVKAGVMEAGEGLHPSSKGARVRFSGGKDIIALTPGENGDIDEAVTGLSADEDAIFDTTLVGGDHAARPVPQCRWWRDLEAGAVFRGSVVAAGADARGGACPRVERLSRAR